MSASAKCNASFKVWWERAGRKNYAGRRVGIPEGIRYGLFWYAYQAGWNGKKRQAVSSEVLGSPGLRAAVAGDLDLEKTDGTTC